MTHNNKHIFYWDDDHVSLQGSKMINDLILREIKKIELDLNKSNQQYRDRIQILGNFYNTHTFQVCALNYLLSSP